MKRRTWNGLLTLFSLAGGAVGFIVGELVLKQWGGQWPEPLLMGVYFGQLALFVGLFALAAETISPKLNGRSWRQRYAADGWKLLVPATLLLLLAAGALFQWLYGFNLQYREAPQDYVLVLDRSESMQSNDPGKQSLKAAEALIGRMDGDKRAAVIAFNDESELIAPLTEAGTPAGKTQLIDRLRAVGEPSGQTDIGKALNAAAEQLRSESGRRAAVILISDGYSDVDLARVLAPYVQQRIPVHTVGINPQETEGNQLLSRIAAQSGGSFHDAQGAQRIMAAFDTIYNGEQHGNLVSERVGTAASGGYYGAARIVLITLIGILLGLALGIIFDNRYLAASFMIGGGIAGLAAGVILETGLQGGSEPQWLYRLAAAIILAVILSFSTLIIAVREDRTSAGWRRSSGSGTSVPGAQRRLTVGDKDRTGKQFR